MPNWSYNYLNICGKAKDVKEFANALLVKESYDYVSLGKMANEDSTYTQEQYQEAIEAVKKTKRAIEPTISMNGILPMPIEYYVDRQNCIDENGKRCRADWYDWHVSNWGTKWDMGEVDHSGFFDEVEQLEKLDDEEEASVGFSYQTAWSPPEAFLEYASEKYPNVQLVCEYEEESGMFYVHTTWENGQEDEHFSSDSEIEWRIYQGQSFDEIMESFTYGDDLERLDEIVEEELGPKFIEKLLVAYSCDKLIELIKKYHASLNDYHTTYKYDNGKLVEEKKVFIADELKKCFNYLTACAEARQLQK